MEQCYAEFLCITRRIGLLGFVVRRHTQVQGISGTCGYRRLEIHFYFENLTNFNSYSGQGSLLIQVHPYKYIYYLILVNYIYICINFYIILSNPSFKRFPIQIQIKFLLKGKSCLVNHLVPSWSSE